MCIYLPHLAAWHHFFLRVLEGLKEPFWGIFFSQSESIFTSRHHTAAGRFLYFQNLWYVCFLANCFSHSCKTQLLVFLTGWSLSLSIRATIGPRINKQGIRLEHIHYRKWRPMKWLMRLFHRSCEWVRLSTKPCPELTNPNTNINSLLWMVSSTCTKSNPNINN